VIASRHSGKRIAILGCATSGVAAARLARKIGAKVTILDSSDSESVQNRAKPLRAEGVSVLLGKSALNARRGFDLAVLSPGIDPSWPLATKIRDQGVPCIGELEFAYQHCSKPIIAITGTNGKTTTTELVECILKAAGIKTIAGANYGVAFSELIYEEIPVDVYTLEVSSFQLELIEEFRAQVAVWLNFAPDHLDRHPTLESYREAKLRIFENQRPDDCAIVNGAEEYPPLAAKKVTFSAHRLDTDFHLRMGRIWNCNDRIFDMSASHLRGLHNAENVMAAMAAAHAIGIPFPMMEKPLCAYRPQRHRCELVAIISGREWINDSKSTNLHSLEAALRGTQRPVVLIAGGKQKGLDYSPLAPLVKDHTTHVFTIGEIRDSLAAAWADASKTKACPSLEAAVREAFAASSEGQTILFSPGTSSFDMFTGYDHRGNVFCELVNKLLEQ
jgi:UDP-N-acetylmuramoylalanine--D-glutamate ligase